MRSLANFILFQVGWFVAVLYPGQQAALAGLAIVAAHLVFISGFAQREFRFILMATVLGSVLDVFHQNLGVLSFPGYEGAFASGMIPAWLVMLWAVFATAINHCLYWMRHYRVVLFGMPPFAGALAYAAAEQAGTIEIGYGLWGVVAIGIGWGVIYPVLVRISQWLESIEEGSLGEQRW